MEASDRMVVGRDLRADAGGDLYDARKRASPRASH
jgi:hypothetical protein